MLGLGTGLTLGAAGFARGGLLICVLSWVFCELLCVGRIILARKPSSALVRLPRDFGRSASEAREVFLANEDCVLAVDSLGWLEWTADGLLDVDFFGWDSGTDRSWAAEAAVVAVTADGSFPDLVEWTGFLAGSESLWT